MKISLIALAIALLCAPSFALELATQSIDPVEGSAVTLVDEYVLDDGFGEGGLGWMGGGVLLVLNQFTVIDGAEVITDLRITGGIGTEGSAITLLIVDDPNNDGNPTDITAADILYSAAAVMGPVGVFTDYPVPNVDIGVAGDSFLVGFCTIHPDGAYPAYMDTDFSQGASWIAGASPPVDCSDPEALDDPPMTLVDDFGSQYACNWMIRANGTNVVAVEDDTWGAVKAEYR